MKNTRLAGLALLASSLAPVFAQAPAPSPRLTLTLDVLSDSPGAKMDGYMKNLVSGVREHWVPPVKAAVPTPALAQQAPAQQKESTISLTLGRNGQIQAMHLETSTRDPGLDKAAWGAIVSTSYAPPPVAMDEPTLRLRIHFIVD